MKNRCLLLLILLLSAAQAVWAQYKPEKVNKKAAQLYSKALEQAEADDFKAGIVTLQLAIKADNGFEDAYLSLAGMYGELKNYQNAIDNYEKAKAIDSNYFLDYNLPYSINLAGKGQFDK